MAASGPFGLERPARIALPSQKQAGHERREALPMRSMLDWGGLHKAGPSESAGGRQQTEKQKSKNGPH